MIPTQRRDPSSFTSAHCADVLWEAHGSQSLKPLFRKGKGANDPGNGYMGESKGHWECLLVLGRGGREGGGLGGQSFPGSRDESRKQADHCEVTKRVRPVVHSAS